MKRTQGFTLIEMMIVIAIIAILAVIAIPAYQDYVIRTQVSEGLSLAAGAKTSVTEFYTNRGAWPADNESAGLAAPSSIAGKYVSSVTASGDPTTITVAFGNAANPPINGLSVLLAASTQTDSGSVRWTCMSPTIPSRYLPTSCRP